jgi:hypothetical protein
MARDVLPPAPRSVGASPTRPVTGVFPDEENVSQPITRVLWTRRWVGLGVAWLVAVLIAGMSLRANTPAVLPLAGLPVALFLGLFVAWGACVMLPTVDDAAALRALTNRPVLGGISQLEGAVPSASSGRTDARFAMLLAGLVVAYGAWLAFLFAARPA